MKKFLLILFAIIMLLCSCSAGENTDSTPDTVSTEQLQSTTATADLSSVQNENNKLKESINEMQRIYEDSLYENIKTYTSNYLSYTGSALNNIEKIKSCVTDDYYKKLSSNAGHARNTNTDYQQSTFVSALFYGDNSIPSNNIKVLALCYQSVINKNISETHTIIYMFDMKYMNNQWLIAGVEKPES
ncbi:MAG: hypothetical protein J1E56_05530 [Ruminococcus sp.]|nr:hypothetical protein [Ruminococcus sp.]